MVNKVVITGGNGFVGQHLLKELEQYWINSEIIIWDLPVVDITNPSTYETLLKEIQPDWIVHLAALADVGKSFKDPELFNRVNALGTQTFLESIVAISPDTKVLAISSADIYGIVEENPIPELPLTYLTPNSPYAESKLAMEKIIEAEFKELCIVARPFPHIGPGQTKGFVTSDFASQIASIEKDEQAPYINVGNLEAQRDFTDVRDVVKAYRLLMEKGRTGNVYNIASGQAISIQEILNRLLALSSADIKVQTDPNKMRPSDNPLLVGDASKLKELTDWQPAIPLDQSLEDILNYWRSNN